MPIRILLCVNCLEPGASQIPVGPDKGSQYDSYRSKIDLCLKCREALEKGDFKTIAARHTDTRTITT